MLSAYAPLLRVPSVAPFLLGGAFARVGGSMFGVSVIVMISSRTGSFGLAGAVSAVGVLVLAIAGPLIGRLIDRHGQRRVALPFIIATFVAGLVMVLLSFVGAPRWTLFVAYGVSAFLPEMGPLSRARWVHIFRGEPQSLHTAMSFEQVSDEGAFIIGPVLAVLLSTLLFPEAGLLAAELFFTLGMVIFLSARATEPPVVARDDRPHGLAVTRPGLLVVAGVLVMTGAIFGSNEVVAVAVTEQAGNKEFSSVILALFALGSMLAGIVFGSRHFDSTLTRRLVLAATGMFLLEAPALVVTNLWGLAAVMLVAGSATAPMLITSLTLAQKLVPPAFVTEGMAVAITGILIGISIGTAVAGWAVEHFGAHAAYAVPVTAGLVAVALATVRFRPLQRAELADA
ncbi:putative transmembrane efflux protein [Nostocoides japonicum T1-X7]|uniref:Putative transmembrane efflux protein n=1 Tax=Nostocoides japonicum T1-X7 TaxID=1194083 RepID=A0A077M4F8_9MICO|nr:putative transmembrane efflux protein [Tetrasphaera japonica T1-X7]